MYNLFNITKPHSETRNQSKTSNNYERSVQNSKPEESPKSSGFKKMSKNSMKEPEEQRQQFSKTSNRGDSIQQDNGNKSTVVRIT